MKTSDMFRILQAHERFCYRIAFFLLEKEDRAVIATERALLELGANRRFLEESAKGRRDMAKTVTAKHSLSICKASAGL